MDKNKKSLISVKLKITIYIASFTVLLLSVIWIFQVFFLDNFYTREKRKELFDTADTIEKNIDSKDLKDTVYALSEEVGADIKIVNYDGRIMYSVQALSFSSILNNANIVNYMTDMATRLGGQCIKSSDEIISDFKKYGLTFAPSYSENENMVYCRLVKSNDRNVYILSSVVLTPVDATVNTIRNQLVYISAAFIVLAVVLGIILARKISQPIIKINESAKCLADGKYDMHFDGSGYREVKELSDTLNYASSELSKVDCLRRELIANVSHDLRTPLTMIKGYGELMRDIPGENTSENIQVIIDEAQRLTGLVNDILSISKIEAGIDSAELVEYDITESVNEIISRYSKIKSLEGYNITFEYSENVIVCADEGKISQVIYNLLNNAVNYTGEDKRVRISQTIVYIDGQKYVRFDVYDTGDGIEPENMRYIWDRYYKENRAHKRTAVGTGLGLSIVKGVLELHGGRYGVQSTLHKGSDFWFALKL